jgi:hypothetical protein
MGVPFFIQMTTKDFDFDAPDHTKIAVGLNLKVSCNRGPIPASDNPLNLLVEVSTNRGLDWRSCGTLVVNAGSDEGFVGFRAMGSTFRFRLTGSGTQPSTAFSIIEMGFKVRLGGIERRRRSR